MKLVFVLALVLALFFVAASPVTAQQNLPVPQASPGASVSQTIGTTEVTVTYHRPGVKGRTIYGGLVPYDAVWRAGANENTTITFTDAVTFGGKEIQAGTYGLHMIPTEGEWIVILSKNATSWGSFFYDKEEDALRISVRTRTVKSQEWLSYQFDELSQNSATLSLRWGELEIPMHIEVDVPNAVIAHARDVYLRGLAGFSWQGWYQAANYCAINNLNLEEAITWADRSIQINRTFTNLYVKALLLSKTGKAQEGTKAKIDALTLANEAAINALGYQYLFGGETDEALELFQINVEKYPDSWNVYDSLGEGYATVGKTQLAIEYYTKALSMAPDDSQKDRIRQVLKTLGSK
jgi:hypothetical protein